MHIHGIKKNGKHLFTGQQWRNKHREQTYRHGERGEEAEMYRKSNMKLTPSYIKQIANGNLLQGSGNSNRGSVYRWDREGDGREVQNGGDTCIPMTDSC